MQRVLILCTGNSCRSQMAETLWESLSSGAWQAQSAGSKPSGSVHPLAIRAMQELGLDISSHSSKSLDSFRQQPFDLVVTVCDHAQEVCPVFPAARETLHWPFEDPADAEGSEADQMIVFRRVRDEISTRIREFLQASAGCETNRSTDSAVEFPGDSRLHIALTVTDMEQSKRFYERLLGVPPSKERPRYAKFEPTDPSVNLTLNEVDGGVAVEGGSAHFGVQVKTVAAVHAAIERLKAAGLETITEEASTCCYAVQDKVWAVDPDGRKWEVFVVLQADVKDTLYAEAGCCGPEVITLKPGEDCG